MMRTRVFPEHNYKGVYFKGKTIRIALDPSKPIEELSYPEFYDVKITDYCEGQCPYCYMDSKPEDAHAEDILGKIDEFFSDMTLNQLPFQVAIGGGEPTTHPRFLHSLVLFHQMGITPNYTTNGMFVERDTKELIDVTKRYCGGVAVSCHPHLDIYWREAAKLFSEAGIRLNFHLIISDKESVDRCKEIYDEWKDVVEYFVLLPHGAQGRADEKVIEWEYLKEVMPDVTNQLAFGANFHPYLTKSPGQFKVSLYEPESMSRFLDLKDMKVYPSSFMLDEEIEDYRDRQRNPEKYRKVEKDVDEDFNFGYPSSKGCDICGKKPAQSEPRFGYIACEKHSKLSPVKFSRVRDGLEEDV